MSGRCLAKTLSGKRSLGVILLFNTFPSLMNVFDQFPVLGVHLVLLAPLSLKLALFKATFMQKYWFGWTIGQDMFDKNIRKRSRTRQREDSYNNAVSLESKYKNWHQQQLIPHNFRGRSRGPIQE